MLIKVEDLDTKEQFSEKISKEVYAQETGDENFNVDHYLIGKINLLVFGDPVDNPPLVTPANFEVREGDEELTESQKNLGNFEINDSHNLTTCLGVDAQIQIPVGELG